MQEEVVSYIVLLALALVCLFKQQLLSKRGREEITMAHLFSNRFAVSFSRGILVSLTKSLRWTTTKMCCHANGILFKIFGTS